MFTGIVADLGTVERIEPTPGGVRLTVTGHLPDDIGLGDSIAVDGVCVSVTSRDEAGTAAARTFTADLMPPTLARTTLGERSAGDRVNLEPPLAANGRFGGHLVTGHVDAVGTVISRTSGELADELTLALPPHLARYLIPQGSLAVDGVSLTIAELADESDQCLVTIGLIPATLAATTLGRREPTDRVNLEVDVLAKQVERLLTVPEGVRV